MISSDQQALLASIQSLASAGRVQTGWNIEHRVEFSANGSTHSTVTCRQPGHAEIAHTTWASISPEGVDVAELTGPEFLATHERTLTQQRDQLAEWIAENRSKEEAA